MSNIEYIDSSQVVVNEDGDIVPSADYDELLPVSNEQQIAYMLEQNRESEHFSDAEALKEALEYRDKVHEGVVPDEVMEVLVDAANAENRYRAYGASKERINKVVGVPLSRALARLTLKGVDISNAFPSHSSDEQAKGLVVPLVMNEKLDNELLTRQQKQIDHLVDVRGMSYSEARQQVLGE